MSNDDPLVAACEHCEYTFPVPWDKRGRVVECPACGGWVDAPDPTAEFVYYDESPVELPVRVDLALRFGFEEGFPRPVWEELLARWPLTIDEELRNRAMTEVAQVWLETLVSVLPPGYAVWNSPNFAVMTALDAEEVGAMLRTLERDLGKLLTFLDGVAHDEGAGPHVILAFAGFEAYYQYLVPLFPEGEYGSSSGMAITGGGYAHIVLPVARGHWREILVHELTHLLVQHLPLPAWVNEGITQMAEGIVGESARFAPSAESFGKQRRYWRESSLLDFWTGQAFFHADEGQEHAYELSETLVRLLHSRSPVRLREFLNRADAADAGEDALQEVFGLSLCDLASEALGEGDWQPPDPLLTGEE